MPYANGVIFAGRLEGHLVALDANTGEEKQNTKLVDYTRGCMGSGRAEKSLALLLKNGRLSETEESAPRSTDLSAMSRQQNKATK